jgi:rhodanese-related sulfurtransferase
MRFLTLITAFLMLIACNNKATKVEEQVENVADVQAVVEPTFSDLDVKAFDKAIETDANAIVVDVRTPEETAEGMIPGALEIDFRADDFKEKILDLDKSKSIYLYCRSGNRSGQASEFLIDNGYSKVYNLEGGYSAWSDSHK